MMDDTIPQEMNKPENLAPSLSAAPNRRQFPDPAFAWLAKTQRAATVQHPFGYLTKAEEYGQRR